MKPELSELIKHIEDNYNGDYASLCHEISKAIYLLHYVDTTVTGASDVQAACFALQRLNECFHKVHDERRKQQYKDKPP